MEEKKLVGMEAAKVLARALRRRKKSKRLKAEGYLSYLTHSISTPPVIHVEYYGRELVFEWDELKKALEEVFKKDKDIIIRYDWVTEKIEGVNPQWHFGYLIIQLFRREDLEKEGWQNIDEIMKVKVDRGMHDGEEWIEI